MYSKRILMIVLIVLSFTAFASTTMAQDTTDLATGLNNPRHISFGSDGTLYIAEAGKGGDQDGEGPYGAIKADEKTGVGIGATGQISVVSPDGTQSVLIPELASMNIGFGQVYGPMDVYASGTSYWVVLGLGAKDPGLGKRADALVQYGRSDNAAKMVVDLSAFENDNNPDQNPDDKVSNPADIAVAEDGTIYLADASANSVLTWTEQGGLKLFAAWPVKENEAAAVPTSVAVGANGDVYVGFLTGFPFTAEKSRIEVYTSAGKLKATYNNLSFITDVLVTEDGTIYAVQFASSFGDQGWTPGSGSVVKVTEDGSAPIAENLNFPYGIALSPDGQLAVSVDTFGAAPDSGRVIALDITASS